MDEVLKDSYMIKTTGNKDQRDICAVSSAGNEIQSVGVKDDELPTAIITVKGIAIYIIIYSNFITIMDS